MKTKLTFLLLFLVGFLFAQQLNSELNCAKFKTGKFELQNDETGLYFIITRTDNHQVEETYSLDRTKKLKDDAFFYVEWVDDCTYLLFLDRETNEGDEWDSYVDAKGGLKTEIIETNNNCYLAETTFEDFLIQSVLCKMEE